jgi:hypothetical protein
VVAWEGAVLALGTIVLNICEQRSVGLFVTFQQATKEGAAGRDRVIFGLKAGAGAGAGRGGDATSCQHIALAGGPQGAGTWRVEGHQVRCRRTSHLHRQAMSSRLWGGEGERQNEGQQECNAGE